MPLVIPFDKDTGANIDLKLLIETDSGPMPAPRPPNELLIMLARIKNGDTQPPIPDGLSVEQYRQAIHDRARSVDQEARAFYLQLIGDGYVLDPIVDWDESDYAKTMRQCRNYGYKWRLSGAMSPPNSVWQYRENAPDGAILVPASEEEDPNWQEPDEPEAPLPPVTDFGELIAAGFFAGSYKCGPADTQPIKTVIETNGRRYVKQWYFTVQWIWLLI